MAVSSTTAPASDTAGRTADRGPRSPIRTCIGCRQRAAAAELLRIVVGPGPSVVPDPQHRAPGRGAWLHVDPGCVELAERRRAFGRALRVSGQIDPTAIVEYVNGTAKNQYKQEDPTSGTPQE